MRLADKVPLITGGQSGIGLAPARRFVEEGARVFLVGLDEGRLKEAADGLGDSAGWAVADVTDEAAVEQATQTEVDRFGSLDVLFSNAGISGAVSGVTEYPSDVFTRTLAVHVTGAFHCVKAALPRMHDGGSIVIT